MVNWWLILLSVIMVALVLFIAIYLVVIFQNEEDRTSAWFPKTIVVIGIALACLIVLMLPLDVANRKNPTTMGNLGTQGLDTVVMWQILLWIAAAWVVVLIPFCTFYYEAYDPDSSGVAHQITQAMLYTFITLLMFGGLAIVLWVTVGVAQIPYWSYVGLPQNRTFDDPSLIYYNSKTRATLELKVSFFVYVVGMLTALGWVLFFVFAGVGLSALPIDTLLDFMRRPKPITAADFARESELIAAKALTMLEIGKSLQQKARRKVSNAMRTKAFQFKNEVYALESSFDRLVVAFKEQGGSFFLNVGRVLVGFIGMGLSSMWVVHVFLYNTFNVDPFLNTLFISLSDSFSLFGVIAYAVFSFWLLWCTVKGCIKVGMRILIIQIHPMKLGDTAMNAFLFNTGMILLSSVVVAQFSARSFRAFAANTAADTLLNTYVRRLKGIGYVTQYLYFGFVFMALFSLFWVLMCPKKKVTAEDMRKRSEEDD